MDTIKQRLARGEVLNIFAAGRAFHHNLIHIAGLHGGFHAVWLDHEHVDLTTHQMEFGTLAARQHGMDSFIRLACTDYAQITRCYEAGAGGIMAAQIRSAAEAEQVVKWSKFFPRGNRGLNTGGWDANFALMGAAAFAEKANREHFVAIQIETLEALEECEAIAAIDGVDLLFLGPADMSQALGVTGEFMHPKCIAALDKIAAACRKHNKPWGVVPPTPEYATMCVEKGCKMIAAFNEIRIFHAGIRAMKEQFKQFFPNPGK